VVKTESAIPSPSEFYLTSPLYTRYPVGTKYFEQGLAIMAYKGPLDVFCPQCGRQSVFQANQNDPELELFDRMERYSLIRATPTTKDDMLGPEFLQRSFICSRNKGHELHFWIRYDTETLSKVGQFPSLADLEYLELQKYRAVLGQERFGEFTRAVGLAAHGVGIGAFVYLRRIFEGLIDEAHDRAAAMPGWEESAYDGLRLDEKVGLLKKELPDFLVENRRIYGILSKGIHELAEQECLEYFPSMRLAIELILDQQLERRQRDEKIRQAREDIRRISKNLADRSS